VNLNDGILEAYSAPSGPTDEPDYQQSKSYYRDDEVPVLIEGNEVARIPVSELLPL